MDIIIKENIEASREISLKNLHIKNDVFEFSIIESVELQVDGTTKEDSLQFVRNAYINIHKGSLRCHQADINILDGGEVHATKVNINTVKSGTIYAQDVTIDTLHSGISIYASNSITIKKITGTNNLLKINYKDVPILKSKIDLINDDIEELKYKLNHAIENNISYIPIIKQEIKDFQKEKEIILQSVKNAVIYIKEALKSENTIIFTVDEKNEIIFKTKPLKYDKFFIEITKDSITLQNINKSFKLNQQ